MPRSRRLRARYRTSGAAGQRLVCGFLALLSAACANASVDPEGSSVDTVVIVPDVATVSMGGTITLQAEARDADGNVLDRAAFWAAADSTIVTVSADGQVTGRKLGRVDIAASVEGKSGLSSLTVSPIPVASVALFPANANLTVGGTMNFVAEARDESGETLASRPVTWLSSNPSVATVTTSGRVTALAGGAAIISADSEGKVGLASVNVVPSAAVSSITVSPSSSTINEDTTVQLTAVYRDDDGRLMEKNFQWFTSDSRIATVSSKGKVTGKSSGTVTIRASASGVSGSASVTVR